MKNLVILISGRGSNMQAILEACEAQKWSAKISAVISNVPHAAGLAFAASHGIETMVVSSKNYTERLEFEAALARVIDPLSPDLIILAGFMRILTAQFVQRYAGRIINIHPSLLPKFKGLNTHCRALQAGEIEHGATVHVVTPELDHGQILGQVRLPILPGDTEESLAQRVLAAEHILYPQIVHKIIEGSLKIPI